MDMEHAKAKCKFFKIFAKVFVDETGKSFQMKHWEDDVGGCRTNILKRLGFVALGSVEDDVDDIIHVLTTVECIKRKERVRQEIRDQARDNEALLEMARRIGDLESEIKELKSALARLCPPNAMRVGPEQENDKKIY